MKKNFLAVTLLLVMPVLAKKPFVEEECPCPGVVELENQAYGFPFTQPTINDGNVYPVERAKKPVFLSRVTLESRLAPTLSPLRYPDIESLGGVWWRNSSDESWLAVNPTNPKNMIVVTHQDRALEAFLGNIILYTKDGGETWQEANVALSKCQNPTIPRSAGDFDSASDPNITFDNQGNAYMNSASFNFLENYDEAVTLVKSTDGGASWTPVQNITWDDGFVNYQDRPGVWNDPYRKHTLYATWSDLPGFIEAGDQNFIRASRTVDAGRTWEPPTNAITKSGDSFLWGAQINVLPNKCHTLVLTAKGVSIATPFSEGDFIVSRSKDGGKTWKQKTIFTDWVYNDPADPELGIPFVAFDVGVDTALSPKNGYLYAVAQDGRFAVSEDRPGGSIITMSKDGGKTWINPLPLDVDHLDAQPFVPTVAVAKDGTVGVLFYDFRNYTDGSPSLDTDAWLALYNEDLTEQLDEIRVTPVSFDSRQAIIAEGDQSDFAFRLGDYNRLQTIGNEFVASFCVTNPPYGIGIGPLPGDEFIVDTRNRQDVLFARIKPKHCKGKRSKNIDHKYWAKRVKKLAKNPKQSAVKTPKRAELTILKKRTRLHGLKKR